MDQSQGWGNLNNMGLADMVNGSGVGQIITPSVDFLERLDLAVNSRGDLRPITLRLWRWDSNHTVTVQGCVLFQDTITAREPGNVVKSVFPRIPVLAGEKYYVELRTDNYVGLDPSWAALHSGYMPAAEDPYAGGAMWYGNWLRDHSVYPLDADLYFRTYDEAVDTGVPGSFDMSDPNLPWTPPGPAGPAVTPDDYYDVVKAEADKFRAHCVNADASTAQYCESYAAYEAFLYKASVANGAPDEAHALAAATMLDNTYAWVIAAQAANKYSDVNLEMTGIAYQFLLGSPSLTPQHHDHIQFMLANTARKIWAGRRGGLDNASLQHALWFKLVTTLATNPGVLTAQEATDWSAYAASVWDEFKLYWDTSEDTDGYNHLSLRCVLELAALFGDEPAIWSEPGFKAYIDRFATLRTPLGPGSAAGSSDGWGSNWATPAWVFEKAATRWYDPYYKWLAYRAFDYHRQHLKGVPMNTAVYGELQSLAFAYFDANTTIPTAMPQALSEKRGAAQDTDVSYAIAVTPASPVGQTFLSEADRIVRIRLIASTPSPTAVGGRLSLRPWLGDLNSTMSKPPLYEEAFDIPGLSSSFYVSFQPHVRVSPNQPYYLHVESTGGIGFRLAASSADVYPGGEAWATGPLAQDLWFYTASLNDDSSSRITTRLKPVAVPYKEMIANPPARYFDLANDVVPDKMILRSGPGEDAFTVLVNLVVAAAGHAQPEPGAVLTVTDDGSVLMHDQGYYAYSRLSQSAAIAKRHWGGTFVGMSDAMNVELFEDYRNATIASLSWGDVDGWSLDQGRKFIFVKDRFLIVRDSVDVLSPMKLSFGAVWRANDMQWDHGADGSWYDVYYREPLMTNKYPFKNPQRSMLVRMVPRPGYSMSEVAEPGGGAQPPTPRYVMTQRVVSPDDYSGVLWADTVLLPHAPSVTPADAAASVTVLYQDDSAGIIAYRIHVSDETWTVVDNPSGVMIDLGVTLRTDAVHLIARTSANSAPMLLTESASCARVDDGVGPVIDRAWSTRTSVEEN
ncbi:hypothetical protein [Sorangium sp. So ce1000]|uniref:hypothetical protein n=1 Tax=Sorangium sp. So ce1000 TaxID=3133325 RepID=UPI003F6303B3